jgi:hypothetical protein
VLRSIVLSERKIGIPGHEPKRADGRDGPCPRAEAGRRKGQSAGGVLSRTRHSSSGGGSESSCVPVNRNFSGNLSGTVKMPLEVLRQLEFLGPTNSPETTPKFHRNAYSEGPIVLPAS